MSLERLVLVGMNHMSSPVRRRERTAVSQEQLPEALAEMAACAGLEEAVLLSTCSRIELIGISPRPQDAARELQAWLRRRGGEDIGPGLYAKTGYEALLHLFRVTAGLDSWIVGESEIQGQVRRAYQRAFELKHTGPLLNRIFQSALGAGKAVRAKTGIQTGINSIGGASALLAQRLFPGAHDGRVVVFGGGEAAEAVARHLAAKDFQEIWVANRTLERARAVAEPLGGRAASLEEGLKMLASAQAAIFSLGCSQAVLDRTSLAPLLEGRTTPLFILDLGLPRNMDESCAALPGVRLYNLDDLKELVRESRDKKAAEKDMAEQLLETAARKCLSEIIKSAAAMNAGELTARHQRGGERPVTHTNRGMRIKSGAASLAAILFFFAAAAAAQPAADVSKKAEPAVEKPAKEEIKKATGAESCLNCHQDMEHFKDTFHGRKVSSSKKLTESCESCHGPGAAHAESSDPAKIINPKKLDAAGVADLCFKCHTNKNVMMWKTSHHSQGGLSCLQCHSVHTGDGRKSLKAKAVFEEQTQTETCLKCHKKQKADMRLPSHHPIPEGKMACVSCHNPHGGIDGNLKADSPQELCARCHAEKAGPFANEHPPVADNCINCHLPHGSHNDKLLKQAQPYLCLNCHKFPHTTTQNGFTGVALSREEQRGNCVDCHKEIHGSDRKARMKD